LEVTHFQTNPADADDHISQRGGIWMDMDGCGWIWVDMVGMKWIQEKVNFDFDFQKFRMETQNGSQ
jgi:hypothetical protein